MSIFGVRRKHVDTSVLRQEISNIKNQTFPHINNLIDRHTELQNIYTKLQNTVREMNIDHRLLYNKVENIPDKKIVTIFAESKGTLVEDEVFSFGNGGKEDGVGYVMNFPGQILGIGLSNRRSIGIVGVVVSINGNHQTGYDITLDYTSIDGKPSGDPNGILLKKHNNFDKPLKVEAGDVIDFVCKYNNHTCVNTVASMIIELFI